MKTQASSRHFTLHLGDTNRSECPFGICSTPKEFQRHVNEIIEDLEGVTVVLEKRMKKP